ncbi:MAG: DUF3604 domain-containing protein [Luminiphilus sp.]|nr:DUF3604 domain-containing protein [Luminiphilus sp.]
MTSKKLGIAASLLLAVFVANEAPADPASKAYSPVIRNASTNLYWGDTHVHSNRSGDAFSMGNENLSPADSYRFARGETIVSSTGQSVRLRRPLDFLAVADHSEYLGVHVLLKNKSPLLDSWEMGKRWAKLLAQNAYNEMLAEYADITFNKTAGDMPAEVVGPVWVESVNTADRFNDPGQFTAFSAYEWTSMIDGDNLHRVVLFKDSADKVTKTLPFSPLVTTDPERLWDVLETYERETGGEVFAIPHNSNVSNGRMFVPTKVNGEPMTEQYVTRRSRWEPIVEVTQTKGDSESHPSLSPTDEFADFEKWDTANVSFSAPKQPWMLQYEYARQALREGLKQESILQTNPFKFGMIGSTDSHTGLSTAAEDNFFGKFVDSEPSDSRMDRWIGGVYTPITSLSASGLAAVWAGENTRGEIFASFKRREVYATSGSRILLRFFGGWDFEDGDVTRPDFDRVGYAKGVPMGGDLYAAPKGTAPRFMIAAARDPDGANLDRIQIIKGWMDAQGDTFETVYDVALSDERTVDPKTGKAPSVGSTVNLAVPTYHNTIGEAVLTSVWSDPDFDPSLRAFYYVRVLEIPTPRWSAFDAVFYNKTPASDVPMVVQDRAYSSPIWYTP